MKKSSVAFLLVGALSLLAACTGPKVSVLGDSYSTYEGVIPAGNRIWYYQPPKNRNDVTKAEECWWCVELKNIDKQKGHPSIAGMKAIADQVTEAVR